VFEALSFSEKAHGGADFVTECVVLSRLGSDASLEVEGDAVSCFALGKVVCTGIVDVFAEVERESREC